MPPRTVFVDFRQQGYFTSQLEQFVLGKLTIELCNTLRKISSPKFWEPLPVPSHLVSFNAEKAIKELQWDRHQSIASVPTSYNPFLF